ncbi:hypothetical protein Dimus_031552, partial [Dionaea muscipula]
TLHGREPYAKVVKVGNPLNEPLPVVRGVCGGNGWLYRSVVAVFGDHRTTDILLDYFIEQERGVINVRRLGNKRILITFPSEERMSSFINRHKEHESYWFKSVEPWSVNMECNFEREVWLSCYGVPVHAWNASTFIAIGQHWGDVIQIDEDTLKCIRCDIGKVKISTSCSSLINQQMKDDEQTRSGSTNENDDDEEEGRINGSSEVGEDNSRILLSGIPKDADGFMDREGTVRNLREEEMRGFALAADSALHSAQGIEDEDSSNCGVTGRELVPFNRVQDDRSAAQSVQRRSMGPILNMKGISLEVVLSPDIGLVNMWLQNTMEFTAQHTALESGNNATCSRRLEMICEDLGIYISRAPRCRLAVEDVARTDYLPRDYAMVYCPRLGAVHTQDSLTTLLLRQWLSTASRRCYDDMMVFWRAHYGVDPVVMGASVNGPKGGALVD